MSEKLSSSAEERNRERQSRCEGTKGGKERIDHLEKREARKREASPPGECERVASLSSREARSIRDTESEREREARVISSRSWRGPNPTAPRIEITRGGPPT